MDPGYDSDENEEKYKYLYNCLIVGILSLYSLFLFGTAILLLGVVLTVPLCVLWILNGLLVLHIEYTFVNWLQSAVTLFVAQLIFNYLKKSYGSRH